MGMSRSLSLTLHFHSLLLSIFYPIFLLIATDLYLLMQITTGTLLSFVLVTTSTQPCSSLPIRGEVSRAMYFTQFPRDQGDLGITTHPTAVLSTAQPEIRSAKLRAI